LIVIKNSVAFVNCIELTVFWQTDGNNTSLSQTALTKAYGRTSLMSPSLDSAAVIPTLILSLHLAEVSTDVHTRRSIYTNMPYFLIHAKFCARIILINGTIYAIILNRNSLCKAGELLEI